MTPDLQDRCNELVTRGQKLASMIGKDGGRPSYWFRSADVPELKAWIASAANLVGLCATPGSYFAVEVTRIVKDHQLGGGVPFHSIQKLLGLLRSLEEEMKNGLMRKAEYVFVASTFDEFLDHADEYPAADRSPARFPGTARLETLPGLPLFVAGVACRAGKLDVAKACQMGMDAPVVLGQRPAHLGRKGAVAGLADAASRAGSR